MSFQSGVRLVCVYKRYQAHFKDGCHDTVLERKIHWLPLAVEGLPVDTWCSRFRSHTIFKDNDLTELEPDKGEATAYNRQGNRTGQLL